MDTLEIPRYELMNYLPYCLIEEALEITPYELLNSNNSKKELRRESRINSYLMKKKSNTSHSNCFQSLFELCNFEQEVSKEIRKIMQKQSIFNALTNDLIFEQTEYQIKNLLNDEDKENYNPLKSKKIY